MKKARFYIKGKVQEVGYRLYIMKEIIKREGLKGIADNYSQALTFEQLGKGMGIPILKNMYRSIEGMSTRIEGMDESIKGMDENIKGMREEMREWFDKLPERIAKEALSKNPVIYHRRERRARRVLRLFQSLLMFSGAFAFSMCSAVNLKTKTLYSGKKKHLLHSLYHPKAKEVMRG